MGFPLVVASRDSSRVAVPSLVAEHGLQDAWASAASGMQAHNCGSRAPEHRLSSCGEQT